MDDELKCLTNNIEFVYKLNKAFGSSSTSDNGKFVGNVDKIDYVCFYDPEFNYYDEFIVINYRGGAIQARNSNWNSLTAIFNEIGPMLTASQLHCGDTETYKKKRESDKYKIYDTSMFE